MNWAQWTLFAWFMLFSILNAVGMKGQDSKSRWINIAICITMAWVVTES